MTTLPSARGCALLALLAATPLSTPGGEPPEPVAAPAPAREPVAAPEPAPRLEPEPLPEPLPGLEPAAVPVQPPVPAAPSASHWRDSRRQGCAILTVGGVASDAGSGFAFDVGGRFEFIALRWAMRVTEGRANVGLAISSTVRATWNFGLGGPLGAYVGAGGGELSLAEERGADDVWTDSQVATLEAGMVVENGWTVLGIGVELLLPLDGRVNGAPTVMLTASINPLALAAGL